MRLHRMYENQMEILLESMNKNPVPTSSKLFNQDFLKIYFVGVLSAFPLLFYQLMPLGLFYVTMVNNYKRIVMFSRMYFFMLFYKNKLQVEGLALTFHIF